MSPKKRKIFKYVFISIFILIGIIIAFLSLRHNWLILASLGIGWIVFMIFIALFIPLCCFLIGSMLFETIEDLIDDGKLNHSNKKDK